VLISFVVRIPRSLLNRDAKVMMDMGLYGRFLPRDALLDVCLRYCDRIQAICPANGTASVEGATVAWTWEECRSSPR
jgi:hypothetical protein